VNIGAVPVISVLALLSEVVAVFLIWRIWRSNDLHSMKIALSVLALIPILGPIVVLWIANFPSKVSEELQNRSGWAFGGEYYFRWSRVLRETNAVRRFALWRREVGRSRNDDP